MTKLLERFIRYAKVSTQSQEGVDAVPSTERQHDLAKLLKHELLDLGFEAERTEHAYVYGTLRANADGVPAIAFCAHIDTALEVSGENVKPRVIYDYDGEDIVLNEALGIVLSPEKFPSLKEHVGKTLVVTDGTTLLGGDDKAGIAEIIDALEYVKDHPDIKHGKIVVCFCPDEEIGHGAALWDLEKHGADLAYTVDGEETATFSYETFNAAQSEITIKGISVHPGEAKDKMVSAAMLAVEFATSLPPAETPSHTEGREGYYHLTGIEGGVDEAHLTYIIRDHDPAKFEARKRHMSMLVRQLNERHGREFASIETRDQYYNMAIPMAGRPDIVETALKAYRMAGLVPEIIAARGGTDGSQLSYRGLLTPNIFSGSYNCHGQYEYVVAESMEKASEVIVNIIRLYGSGSVVSSVDAPKI